MVMGTVKRMEKQMAMAMAMESPMETDVVGLTPTITPQGVSALCAPLAQATSRVIPHTRFINTQFF